MNPPNGCSFSYTASSSLPSTCSGTSSLMARIVAFPLSSRVITAGATGAAGPSITAVDCAKSCPVEAINAGTIRKYAGLIRWRRSVAPGLRFCLLSKVRGSLVDERLELLTERVGIRRRALRHQNGDGLAARLNPKDGARRAVPAVLAVGSDRDVRKPPPGTVARLHN